MFQFQQISLVLLLSTGSSLALTWNPLWTLFGRDRDGLNGKSFNEDQNKRLVMNFYQEVFGDKNVDAADKYIDANTYIQHNPHVADGLEPFKSAAKEWFEGAPKEQIEFQQIAGDGNMVWVHTKAMHDGVLTSVVDIFKVKDGKLVEHWDVMQAVPNKSMNDHPMF